MIANDTRVDGHHGCSAVMTTLERLLEAKGMSVVARYPAHSDWRQDAQFLKKLASVRLLVVNGEGTIHHDRAAGRRLLELGAAARSLGVPAALVNTSWEANSDELTAMLADFALVAARDTVSAAQMRSGVPEVRVVPDLSLCADPEKTGQARRGIGVTDNVDRIKALVLSKVRREAGGTWVSIHHRSPWMRFVREGLSLRTDLPRPLRLARLAAMRTGLWAASQDDLGRFMARLAGLELLISGRFHACTLALVSGTPFLAQSSNTGKIAALIADAGLDPARGGLPEARADFVAWQRAGWNPAEAEARLEYLALARSRAEALAVDLRALAA